MGKEIRMNLENNKILKRFHESYLIKNECWIWQKCVNPKGYGYMSYLGKPTLAHRASWMIHNGDIPKGKLVLHTCDLPPCVRPSHLWLGDAACNTNDMMKKGRYNYNKRTYKGSDSSNSKITEETALKIKQMMLIMPANKVAEALNVSLHIVYDIRNNKTWKHISLPDSDQNEYFVFKQGEIKGEDCGSSKLTNNQVKEIKRLLLEKIPQRKIASLFGVTQCTINYINTGKIWSHIKIHKESESSNHNLSITDTGG